MSGERSPHQGRLRRWFVAGGVVLGLAALGYAALLEWTGERIEQVLSDRLGLEARIGSVRVWPGTLRLRRVELGPGRPVAADGDEAQGLDLTVTLATLLLRGSVLGMARAAPASIEAIEVESAVLSGSLSRQRLASAPDSEAPVPETPGDVGSTPAVTPQGGSGSRPRGARMVASWTTLLAPRTTLEIDRLEVSGSAGSRFEARSVQVQGVSAGTDAGAWTLALEAAIRDAAIAVAELAPRPVVVAQTAVDATVEWRRRERAVSVKPRSVAFGPIALTMDGAFQRDRSGWLLEAETVLERAPCDEVLGALPPAILGAASGFRWLGTVAGSARLAVDSRRFEESQFGLEIDQRCTFRQVPEAARPERFRAPFEHRVIAADGSEIVHRNGPGSERWVPLAEISPYLVHAVLEQEDDAFFEHRGFAPWTIEEALRHNLVHGEFVFGASTITMQLARTLFLNRDKNLARKIQESLFAWWLEESLSKREILELYLNVIDYGSGVYGVRDACRVYFGRRPGELRLAEAAFLATALTAPSVYHQQLEAGSLGERTAAQMRSLIRRMHASGRIDRAAMSRGVASVARLRFHRGGGLRPPSPPPPGWTGVLPRGAGS